MAHELNTQDLAAVMAEIRTEAMNVIDTMHPQLCVDDIITCCMAAGELFHKRAQIVVATHDRLSTGQRDFVLLAMSTGTLLFESVVKCLMKNPMRDSPVLFRAQLKAHIEHSLDTAKVMQGDIKL